MSVVGDRRPMSADRLYGGLHLELEANTPDGPTLTYWRIRRVVPGNAGNLRIILDPVTDRGRPDDTRRPSAITVRGGRMLTTVTLA